MDKSFCPICGRGFRSLHAVTAHRVKSVRCFVSTEERFWSKVDKHGPNGRTGHEPDDWKVYDDGASPSRSSRGIRGGIGNPVIGSMAVGSSRYSGKIEKRTGAHAPKVRP